jgi:O-antigen/teichoic acid export membrane protein
MPNAGTNDRAKAQSPMKGIRRALMANTGERYITLSINFILIALVSRILTPRDIGIAALGATAISVIECFREQSNFLIQRKHVDATDRQTVFTIMSIVTILLIICLLLCSSFAADAYQDPNVARYIFVLAAALLPGPFERPLMALLRRQLRFAELAIVNIATVVVNAATTIALALLDYQYMAFAWGLLVGNVTALLIVRMTAGQPNTYKLTLARWRSVLSVSGFSALSDLSGKAVELVTYLIIGRGARLDSVGLFSRALSLNALPEKFFVAGISQVAFPAVAEYARQGRDLRIVLLRAFTLTTALHFPAYAMLALLSYPIVDLILGPQWTAASALLQIVALAGLCSFATPIAQPTFMAIGAFKDLFIINLVLFPVRIAIVIVASLGGLHWLAWSVVLRAAIAECYTLYRLRHHIAFNISDLLRSLMPSILVTLATTFGPILVVASNGFDFHLTFRLSVLVVLLSTVGWFGSIWLIRHPVREEVTHVTKAIYRKILRLRVFGAT